MVPVCVYKTYEAISRVDTHAALVLSHFNYTIAIEVRGRVPKIDGELGAQRML